MLTNCLAACAHLTITVSEIQRDICETVVIFTARCVYISAVYAVTQCPSVRLSRSCIMANRIKISSNFFSPSGSDTILVFPSQRGDDIPTGTPLTGASNARGMIK